MDATTISTLTVLILEPILILVLGLYIAANRTIEQDLEKLNTLKLNTSAKLNILFNVAKNLILNLWRVPVILLDFIRVLIYNLLSHLWDAAMLPFRRIKSASPHFKEGLKILLLGDDRYVIVSPYALKSANPTSADPAPQQEVGGKKNKSRSTTKSRKTNKKTEPELLSPETKEKLPKLSNDPKKLRDVDYLRSYSKQLQDALAEHNVQRKIKVDCSATVLLERLNKILATL